MTLCYGLKAENPLKTPPADLFYWERCSFWNT